MMIKKSYMIQHLSLCFKISILLGHISRHVVVYIRLHKPVHLTATIYSPTSVSWLARNKNTTYATDKHQENPCRD